MTTERIPFHAAAAAYPLLGPRELQALADDIKARGLELPITRWRKDGSIIDGRNRYLACRFAGVEPAFAWWDGPEEELPAKIDSLNLHRRHLTAEQRREVIARRLAETPRHSNRRVAADLGVSYNTVRAERAEMEAAGQIDHLDRTVGLDGKEYPAAGPAPAAPAPDPALPRPVPAYTNGIGKMLDAVRGQLMYYEVEKGGIEKMLETPEKFDWLRATEELAPALEELGALMVKYGRRLREYGQSR